MKNLPSSNLSYFAIEILLKNLKKARAKPSFFLFFHCSCRLGIGTKIESSYKFFLNDDLGLTCIHLIAIGWQFFDHFILVLLKAMVVLLIKSIVCNINQFEYTNSTVIRVAGPRGWRILALLHFYAFASRVEKMQMCQNVGGKALVF
jgi:hypothetical protein